MAWIQGSGKEVWYLMTEKEWKQLPLPTESPLVPYKRYRGSKVTWSSGKTAYYWVEYHF